MDNNVKYLIEENNNDIDFMFLIKILIKNSNFFGILFISLLALFILFIYGSREAEYSASFPLSINNIASEFVVNDLKNVSKFTNSELKEKIKCTAVELKQLNFIQISNITNEEDKHKATININANSPENLKSIADKIIAWTSNNSQIEELVKNKKNSINSLIKKTDQQLIEIEVMKNKITNSENLSESKFSFIEEYKILEKKYSLLEELEDLNQVVAYSSQIYIPNQAKNKSKTIPLFFSIIVSLIIAVLSTLIVKYKKV
jgi:hypothetical protein